MTNAQSRRPRRVALPLGPVVALVAVVLASGACTPLDDAMAAVFGRSMRDQRSFDPYENTTVMLPPEGSVPMSAGNFAPGPFAVNLGQPEGSPDLPPPFTQADLPPLPPADAAATPPAVLTPAQAMVDGLVNPVPASAESLARGEVLYERVCIVCHGPDGSGSTGYIFEVHPAMAAYPLRGARAVGFSDGYLYAIIRTGRGLMPSYAHQIGHYDRWHIVNYLRQLQGVAPGAEN